MSASASAIRNPPATFMLPPTRRSAYRGGFVPGNGGAFLSAAARMTTYSGALYKLALVILISHAEKIVLLEIIRERVSFAILEHCQSSVAPDRQIIPAATVGPFSLRIPYASHFGDTFLQTARVGEST